MTLPSNYVPDVSIGNGVTTQFSGNWTPLNASWFRMVLEEIATGIQTPLSLGSDFTLVFDNSGYLATITSGAPSSAYRVIRYREVTIDQTVPYKTSKGFQGFVQESSFDKGIAISQDLSERLDRSITLPIGSTAVPQLAAPVPSNLIGWDSLGQNLINYVITDLSTYPVTTLGAAIIGSATAEEVRDLIEIPPDETSLVVVIGDRINEITTGIKGDVSLDFDGEILGYTMLANETGSVVVDIWKDTYGNYPPTDDDSITDSSPMTITTDIKEQDTTLSGWTTSFSEGDTLRFNVDSVTDIKQVSISLKVRKS